jgi:nuclear GTP-binding protein
MKKKAVCKSAPIPGETKVWQYVTLTNRMYLIDCPGVVYDCGDSETEKVLKGIVRAEKLEDPIEYCEGILQKAKKKYLQDTYCVEDWVDLEDFLTQIANKTGKLLKVHVILNKGC